MIICCRCGFFGPLRGRWGLLFVPAYLACSAWLWLRGYDAYLDNPFEVEAYGLYP